MNDVQELGRRSAAPLAALATLISLTVLPATAAAQRTDLRVENNSDFPIYVLMEVGLLGPIPAVTTVTFPRRIFLGRNDYILVALRTSDPAPGEGRVVDSVRGALYVDDPGAGATPPPQRLVVNDRDFVDVEQLTSQ